jgi:ferritin-like metal-binding protein YciE
MPRDTFDDLFIATLGEVYDAEAQLAVGLPVLKRAQLNDDLARLVASLHDATCSQMLRLEAIFDLVGRDAKSQTCWSVAPLVVDAYDAMQAKDTFSRHSGVGLALLSVTHLQIVRYQSLAAWSLHCDMEQIAELLQEPLATKVMFARQLTAHALAADRAGLYDLEPATPTIN